MATIDFKGFEPHQAIHDQRPLGEMHKSSFLQAFGALVSADSRTLDSKRDSQVSLLGRI